MRFIRNRHIVMSCTARIAMTTATSSSRVLYQHVKRLSSKTFVSNHYVPDTEDMKKVVAALDSDTRVQNDGVLSVKVCRLCTKGNKDDMGNLWKLLIRRDGSYHCYRCTQGIKLSRTFLLICRCRPLLFCLIIYLEDIYSKQSTRCIC